MTLAWLFGQRRLLCLHRILLQHSLLSDLPHVESAPLATRSMQPHACTSTAGHKATTLVFLIALSPFHGLCSPYKGQKLLKLQSPVPVQINLTHHSGHLITMPTQTQRYQWLLEALDAQFSHVFGVKLVKVPTKCFQLFEGKVYGLVSSNKPFALIVG